MPVLLPVARLVPNFAHFLAYSYASTTVLSVYCPVASPISLLAGSLAGSTIVLSIHFSVAVPALYFYRLLLVANLVALFRASAALSLWWVFIKKVMLCLCCLSVTIELEKRTVNCQRSAKCRAIYQAIAIKWKILWWRLNNVSIISSYACILW